MPTITSADLDSDLAAFKAADQAHADAAAARDAAKADVDAAQAHLAEMQQATNDAGDAEDAAKAQLVADIEAFSTQQ